MDGISETVPSEVSPVGSYLLAVIGALIPIDNPIGNSLCLYRPTLL